MLVMYDENNIDDIVGHIFNQVPNAKSPLVAIELEVKDDNGNVVEGDVYNVVDFLVDAMVQGFIKLNLDPNAALDVNVTRLNIYFTVIAFQINISRVMTTVPYCMIDIKTGQKLHNIRYNFDPNRDISEIYVLVNDTAISFSHCYVKRSP